jgi:hypothetical protein
LFLTSTYLNACTSKINNYNAKQTWINRKVKAEEF